MRTTDSIIEDLIKSRDELLAAGERVDVSAVQQEIIAHQELARLRARRVDLFKAKQFVTVSEVDAQIQHWLRFVPEDVDDKIVDKPEKDSTKLVDPLAAESPAKA